MIKEITGIILAGGQNRRFGSDKAFIRLGGRYLIERILDTLKGVFDEVIIVTNSLQNYQQLGCKLVQDIFPGKGCLGGLYTGMKHSSSGSIFAVACDMPFLNGEFVEYLCRQARGYDVVIPRTAALQPMHAVYSSGCLPHMEELMEQGNLKILDFFHQVRVKEIGPEEVSRFDSKGLMFYNINTPEDFEEAQRLYSLSCRES